MQVILDSLSARPGSAPIWGGEKGEFRDWTIYELEMWGERIKIGRDNVTYKDIKIKTAMKPCYNPDPSMGQ